LTAPKTASKNHQKTPNWANRGQLAWSGDLLVVIDDGLPDIIAITAPSLLFSSLSSSWPS